MPEMPEVETVRKILSEKVVGSKIEKVIVKDEVIIKDISPYQFANEVANRTINEINRYGKYLFFDLGEITMISHLRMEGKYFTYDLNYQLTKHDHIAFKLDNDTLLVYNDTRKFGTMQLVASDKLYAHKAIAKLGKEPLSEELTWQYIQKSAKGKTKTVKEFLLDQTIVCGLGNIYVDEVLFMSKIHPKMSVANLKPRHFKSIVENINIVIAKAIAEGGTTVKSFMASNEAHGLFQHSLNVYGKKGQNCPNCQTTIEKIKVGGRGTHFCPKCQRLK